MRFFLDSARDAKVDLIDLAHYLSEREGARVVTRFISATRKAFERLAEAPGIGTPRDYDNPRYAGMRMTPIPEFPKYLIFYRVEGDILKIIRVLHGARDLQAIFGRDEDEE